MKKITDLIVKYKLVICRKQTNEKETGETMKAILVDNDIISMQEFESRCNTVSDIEIVGIFTSPFAAQEYAKQNPVDFALLAIEMPNMNGFELYDSLRKIRPEMILVFSAAQEIYAVQAIRKKADYIIFKPYEKEAIFDVLSRVRLLSKRLKKKVYCHTFGRFEVFSDTTPIVFKSSKAKEVLALCVYRQGALVTSEEIITKLWKSYKGKVGDCSVFRYTIKQLVDTLKYYHINEILKREKGSFYINMDLVNCDYYEFSYGDQEAIEQFQGEFMVDYQWAKPTLDSLRRKKIRYLDYVG